MLLRVPEGPTYTVYMRRAYLTSSLNNQINNSLYELTQRLQRACLEVTTIQFYLDFYVQSNTFPISTPIQLSGFAFILLSLPSYPASRFQMKLRNHKVRVVAGNFSALLYPHDGFDPDDLESRLFRNPILLRISSIHICSFPNLEAHVTC